MANLARLNSSSIGARLRRVQQCGTNFSRRLVFVTATTRSVMRCWPKPRRPCRHRCFHLQRPSPRRGSPRPTASIMSVSIVLSFSSQILNRCIVRSSAHWKRVELRSRFAFMQCAHGHQIEAWSRWLRVPTRSAMTSSMASSMMRDFRSVLDGHRMSLVPMSFRTTRFVSVRGRVMRLRGGRSDTSDSRAAPQR